MAAIVEAGIGYKPALHITNTSGIARFKDAQFDMVRLGIGLYGVGNSPAEQQNLATVTRWMTRISQLKKIEINKINFLELFIHQS